MKKTSLFILIATIASLIFSACTMSASTPPPVTPTTNLSEIARQATETAIAKTPKAGETQVPEETQSTELESTATPAEVELPTSTPVPTEAEEQDDTEVVTEYPVPDSYTLHQGEFIFCLARRFNILPDDIKTYNGFEDGTILYPGDTIQLPPNGRPFVGNRALRYHPDTYTASFGDTPYSIACLYGDVDPRAIAAANDISVDQELNSGTVLQIP